MLQHAGDEHDHNPSDHGHDSTATACTNDDYNDAHGRRLLIAKACRGRVSLWPSAHFKSSAQFDRLQVCTLDGFVGTVNRCSQ